MLCENQLGTRMASKTSLYHRLETFVSILDR